MPMPDCPKSKPRTQLFAAISLVTTRLWALLVPKVLVLVFEPVEPPMVKFAIGWPAPKPHDHRSRDLKVKRVSCQLEPAVLVARRKRTPSD